MPKEGRNERATKEKSNNVNNTRKPSWRCQTRAT